MGKNKNVYAFLGPHCSLTYCSQIRIESNTLVSEAIAVPFLLCLLCCRIRTNLFCSYITFVRSYKHEILEENIFEFLLHSNTNSIIDRQNQREIKLKF
jgi:hypothetical protein